MPKLQVVSKCFILIRVVLSMDSMEWLTIKQTADLLQVSSATIRRHIEDIPHIRIGTQIRIPKNYLQGWVDAQLNTGEE
jgi:excisionase family DNA binding protein